MKGLLHINILEDFTTKQKYTHKGNRMLIGSSMLAVHAAFLCSGSFHRGLHRRCMPWERKGTWMKPWRSCESCCAGVRMWIYPTCEKQEAIFREAWLSYKCCGQSVPSKIPLWTRKLTFKCLPVPGRYNNTYSSDSHCTENFLPPADIVLTQWISSPKHCCNDVYYGVDSHIIETWPELPVFKWKLFYALYACDRR